MGLFVVSLATMIIPPGPPLRSIRYMGAVMQKKLAAAAVKSPSEHFLGYSRRLSDTLLGFDWTPVVRLAEDLRECWRSGRQVFLCGNGGSAGNASHLANDFLYPLSKTKGSGIRAHALTENPAVLTCLGNDEGYDNIFTYQLAVLANKGDVLLAFSGSGNSSNILSALEEAKRIGMKSYAILGYSGGKAKAAKRTCCRTSNARWRRTAWSFWRQAGLTTTVVSGRAWVPYSIKRSNP